MIYRLKTYKEKLAKGAFSKPVAVKVAETKSQTPVRSAVCECDCEIKCLQDTDSEQSSTKKAKMTVYTSKASGDSNNKPLFLDITEVDDANKQVLSKRFLKSVKLKSKSAGDELSFEVAQSFHVSYKVNSII